MVIVPVGVKKEIPAELTAAIDGIVATCKAAGIRFKVPPRSPLPNDSLPEGDAPAVQPTLS